MRLRAHRQPSTTAADNVRSLPGSAQLDDVALVRRACDGDTWAEEALYRRHVSYIMSMVTRLLGDRGEAEDVVQETFAIGLDRLASLRDPDAVRGWLAQIAVHFVKRRLRRTKVLSAFGLARPIDHVKLEALALQEPDAERHMELSLLGKALADLAANERVAWTLRHVQGESLDEVARICGCSLATAKRRIQAATKHLQERVGALEEEPR
jgi:RNA polymerase sigma-70 factor (ECF subfamily)